MIFPYLDMAPRGERRSLPVVPIRLRGPLREVELLGLVDSGAEQSVANFQLIEFLGLDTRDALAMRIIGVGGKEGSGYLLEVEQQLHRYRWTAPVVFSEAVESPIILGQAGFSEYFTVTFKRRSLTMDIRRSR